MKKLIYFIVKLAKATMENNLITHANDMTYKMLLAFFPFIIFLMSLLGFFNLDLSPYMPDIINSFPKEIVSLIHIFTDEVIDTKNAGVLSGSLLITLFTISSGFNALIKGISKVYGEKETRNFIVVRLISIGLVLLFTFSIVLSIVILIFGNTIYNTLLKNYALNEFFVFIFSAAGYLVVMIILLFTIIFIYKFSTCKKLTVYEAFPGAFTTLVVWVLSSKLFNVYIGNFAKYSKVYGSIAGIVILLLWLNIISTVLLIGGEINSLIEKKKA